MRYNVCAACGLEDCGCGCEGDPNECVCGVRSNPNVCGACGLMDCSCGCGGDLDKCVCDYSCVACGLVNCPCQCGGDPDKCICDVRINPDVCAACGLADCRCGCGGNPNECVCDIQIRWNPECGKCGRINCKCETLGYCVCDGNRRNPDPDGEPWGPSLYNPLKDNNHQFKDDSIYRSISSRFRRNPRIRRII